MVFIEFDWSPREDENMGVPLSLSEEELRSVKTMAAAALDLISVEAAIRDGAVDDKEAEQRRNASKDRIDVALALDLADRLGENTLREAMEKYTPPSVGASIEALVKRDRGTLPLLKDRIEQMRTVRTGITPFQDDSGAGCAIGAIGVVAGVAGNGVIGGVAAVAGIMLMAECC